jgi:hypothetical protein
MTTTGFDLLANALLSHRAFPGNDRPEMAGEMTRRKVEITARMNERDYPHIVELALPPGGFRSRSDAMLAFHRERGIQIRRGQGRNDDGQFYVRYCFADPIHADAFCDQFGGAATHLPP